MTTNKIRILVAKPGLDGHDRGAKIICLALRDAGFEVIYTGLHQSLEKIINAAIQESADVIGLSIMSGAHLPLCQKLIEMMKESGLEGSKLVVGGVIPNRDIKTLNDMGVRGVFPGGTSFEKITKSIQALF